LATDQVEVTEEELKQIQEAFKNHVAEIEHEWKQQMAKHPFTCIIYCQATYQQDFGETQKCVERVSPHVDYTIIAEDGSLSAEQVKWLKSKNCIVKTFEFRDSLPEMRNHYLEEAKKIDPWGWCLISDPDELMSETLCLDLRKIVKALEEHGYNLAGINCREAFEAAEWLDNLDLLKESPGGYRVSNFWKNLLFKLNPSLHYLGIGHLKTVHETWFSPDVPWRSVNLDIRYWYEHRKSALKIWRNAARNVFIGGGGDNFGDLIPQFRELRKTCSDLALNTWREFEAYLVKGQINGKLKEFLVNCLTLPATNWGTEYREMAKWYFAMHTDEVTDAIMEKIKAQPPIPQETEIEAWVTKCYFDILGRHPDEEGKRFYTRQILVGSIPKDHLPVLLRNSQEYKEKFGQKPI
jgi:hypothetical protein